MPKTRHRPSFTICPDVASKNVPSSSYEHFALPSPASVAEPATPPLVVAGPEHSIRDLAQVVCDATGFAGALAFDTDALDGPLRRTADTSVFEALCPDFAFTPLAEGIRETAEWYRGSTQEAAVA